MRGTEHFSISNQSAGSYPVIPDGSGAAYLLGGKYQLSAKATWGGGSVKVQVLGPDGSTYLDIFGQYDASAAEQNEPINTLTADGALNIDLPPGVYKLLVTTATAVYASLTRVPVSE